jgi:hypothetical protein
MFVSPLLKQVFFYPLSAMSYQIETGLSRFHGFTNFLLRAHNSPVDGRRPDIHPGLLNLRADSRS